MDDHHLDLDLYVLRTVLSVKRNSSSAGGGTGWPKATTASSSVMAARAEPASAGAATAQGQQPHHGCSMDHSVLTSRSGAKVHSFRRIYLGPSPVSASKAVSVALTLAQAEAATRQRQLQREEQQQQQLNRPDLPRAHTSIPVIAAPSSDDPPGPAQEAQGSTSSPSSPRVRRIGLPPEQQTSTLDSTYDTAPAAQPAGAEPAAPLATVASPTVPSSAKRRGRLFRDRSDVSFASNISFQSARSMPSSVLSEPMLPLPRSASASASASAAAPAASASSPAEQVAISNDVDGIAEADVSAAASGPRLSLPPATQDRDKSKDRDRDRSRGRSRSQNRSQTRERSRSRTRHMLAASSSAMLPRYSLNASASQAGAGGSSAGVGNPLLALEPGAIGTSAGGTKWVGATFEVGAPFHEVATRRRERAHQLEVRRAEEAKRIEEETQAQAEAEAKARRSRSSLFLVLNDQPQPFWPVSSPRPTSSAKGTFIGRSWLPANPITEHDEDDVPRLLPKAEDEAAVVDERRPSDVLAALKAGANRDTAQRSREASGVYDDASKANGSASAVPNVNFDLPLEKSKANGHANGSPTGPIPWPSSRNKSVMLPGSGTSTAIHSEEDIVLHRSNTTAPNSRGEKDPTVSRKTVLKRDRMLIKENWTPVEDVPADFDEMAARRYSIHNDKWRELLVILRMRRVELWQESRVHRKKRLLKLRTSIPLYSSETHLSVYSKTDNIFCLTFEPSRRRVLSGKGLVHLRRSGTNIILFNPRYPSAAVDWMWEIWRELGGMIPPQIDVHLPALDLHVRLPVPDEVPEHKAALEATERTSAAGALLLHSSLARQYGHAEPGQEGYRLVNRQSIIGLVLQLVEAEPQLREMLDWLVSGGLQLELAWRRDKTLDWIIQDLTVEMEPRCWATLTAAMAKKPNSAPVLELRVAEHDRAEVRSAKGVRTPEPPAIEGFLWRVRPVSNTLDRIYISTHDGHIFLSRPSRAFPPDRHLSGPGLGSLDLRVPRTDVYSVAGSRRKNNTSVEYESEHVSKHTRARRAFEILFGRTQTMKREDEMAAFRAQVLDLVRYPGETDEELDAQDRLFQTWQRRRQFEQIDGAEGYVDLRDIYAIRTVAEVDGTSSEQLLSGEVFDIIEADFGGEEGMNTSQDKTLLRKLRQFEIVHSNGRSIRLEAFSAPLARQWIAHLMELKEYWKRKERMDALLLMQVEGSIDPSQFGERAQRALAKKRFRHSMSEAERISPLLSSLWNWCIVEGCRGIIRSGKLYHKRTPYAPYERGYFILIGGRLLGYALSTSERTARARQNAGIFWRRRSEAGGMRTIPLRDAFVFSGSLTDDLRGAGDHGSFEGGAKTPAGSLGVGMGTTGSGGGTGGERHTLPRVYADGMISTDEDEDCTFVIRYRKQSQDRPSALPSAVRPLRRLAERSAAAAAALFTEDNVHSNAEHGKRRAVKAATKVDTIAESVGVAPILGPAQTPVDPSTLPRMNDRRNVAHLVMRARSKLERELWVWAIRLEMERLVRDDLERDQALRELGVLDREGSR